MLRIALELIDKLDDEKCQRLITKFYERKWCLPIISTYASEIALIQFNKGYKAALIDFIASVYAYCNIQELNHPNKVDLHLENDISDIYNIILSAP
jgi:hypothetical protein